MLLSVIVPVYNAEKYLNKCIDSIINQSFRDFELILVNDGSTDNSGKICDEYALKDNRIRVIHGNNQGVLAARKEGLNASSGKYVTFVDSDDWIDNNMYETMMAKTAENNIDMVICDIVRETRNDTVALPNYVRAGFFDKSQLKEEFYPVMIFDFKIGNPAVIPSLCNKIIKRELIEKIIFTVDDSIVFGEDALCSYPCILCAEKIYVIKESFYHYRQNFASVTNVYDQKLLRKFLLLHDELKEQFEKCNFDEKDQLYGYVASYSIICIRKELLNKADSLKKRIEIVKKYLEDKRVEKALLITYGKISDKKTRLKIKLAIRRHLVVLYLLFAVKDAILELRGQRYED